MLFLHNVNKKAFSRRNGKDLKTRFVRSLVECSGGHFIRIRCFPCSPCVVRCRRCTTTIGPLTRLEIFCIPFLHHGKNKSLFSSKKFVVLLVTQSLNAIIWNFLHTYTLNHALTIGLYFL